MNVFKYFLRLVASSLFSFFLFIMVATACVWSFLGRPEKIKGTLKDSGLYDNIVKTVLTETEKSGEKSLPSSDKDVLAAAQKSFSSSDLNSKADEVIDGVYAWLKGEVAQPNFSLNFGANRQALSENLAAAAKTRLEKLPVCQGATQTNLDDFDIFDADCRPANLSISKTEQEVKESILGSDFISDTPVTGENMGVDEQGRSVFDRLSFLPGSYRLAGWAPYVSGVMATLSALAIILLSKDRKKGMRNVARTLGFGGVFLTIGAILAKSVDDSLINRSVSDGGIGNSVIVPLMQQIANTTSTIILWFGVVLVSLCVLLLVLARNKKTEEKPDTQTKPEPSTEDTIDIHSEDTNTDLIDKLSPDAKPSETDASDKTGKTV